MCSSETACITKPALSVASSGLVVRVTQQNYSAIRIHSAIRIPSSPLATPRPMSSEGPDGPARITPWTAWLLLRATLPASRVPWPRQTEHNSSLHARQHQTIEGHSPENTPCKTQYRGEEVNGSRSACRTGSLFHCSLRTIET